MAPEIQEDTLTRWRFSRTISLDSVIVLVVTLVSGLVFVLTLSAKVESQARDIAAVQKLVERVEADQKERTARIESNIKEQTNLVQQLMYERYKR